MELILYEMSYSLSEDRNRCKIGSKTGSGMAGSGQIGNWSENGQITR